MSDARLLAALPFNSRRSTERIDASSYSSTTHTVHGLLLLREDRLVMQWRTDRKTERMGAASIETDREIDPVREHVVPLSSVAGAAVRRSRWPFVKPRFVLRAADLLAFEEITGAEGLELDHPGELPLRIRREDLLTAEEFAAELALAVARGEAAERRLPSGASGSRSLEATRDAAGIERGEDRPELPPPSHPVLDPDRRDLPEAEPTARDRTGPDATATGQP